jgi:hypothetical protein
MNPKYNYLPNPLPQEELFTKMKFSNTQLDALKTIFQRYFISYIDNFQYTGKAISIFWNVTESSAPSTFNHGWKPGDTNIGVNLQQDTGQDPLWQEFKDILPYMNSDATITVLPPMSVMTPHIDRPSRAHGAMYFPISGCTSNGFTDYYHLPKNQDSNVQHATLDSFAPLYTYTIVDNAFLMNTQEWHGARNMSGETRIAFGWNPKPGKSYSELRTIFKSLGYAD